MNKQKLINDINEIINSLESSLKLQKQQVFLTCNYDVMKQQLTNAKKLKAILEEENNELSEMQEMYYKTLIEELKLPVM